MVMWFNVKEAREFLLKKGSVYTLRPKRRKREDCREVLMYDGFGKKGTIWVSFIKEIEDDSELDGKTVKYSGFESVEGWREKAKDSRFLYYVILLDGEEMRSTKQK